MKITTPKLFLFTFGVAALLPLLAPAASITLTNSDGLGGSSFNAKGFWNSSTAPMAGNDYIGGNFLLRTPPNASSHTFGGDSLTINNNNGTAGGLAYKGTGTNGILTITNLILDGGLVFQLNGAGDLFQLAGGITVLSSGTVDTRQGLIVVHSALAGSGNLTNTTSQNADRAIVYTGNNSSFLGRMVMANANSRLQITNEINLGGNPAVFTPDALLIQAGWLQSGLTNNVLLNDANRGITLNGTWSVNPQAASSITIVCPIVGAGEIWKRGPGVLALAGDNSGHFGGVRLGAFSAGSQVNVNSTTALGTGPLIIPNDGNQPTLDNGSGSALTTAGNNNQNWNRSFTFLGSSSLNLGSGLVTLGNNVAVTVSNNTLTVGAVVEDGLIRSLTKQGPGTLVINGGASHLGNTVVNEGVLTLLTAGIASSPTITVASNATLNVSGLGVTLAFGQTLAGSGIIIGNVADGGSSTLINPGPGAGTLSITGNLALNGGGAVNFDLTGVTTVGSGVNDLIAVSGELNFAGATTINILGAPATGIYTLFQYGSFAGSLANVTVPPGFTLTNNTTAKTIELIAAHIPANLTWRGDGAVNTWDVGVTANWIQSGTNQFFFNTDTVTFDNTGSNTPAIALASELSPAAVIVNASQDYTFSGSGIASGSLTKNGAGTLVLDNTNTYSGPTVINAGTLQLGDSTGAAGGTTFGVAGNIGTGPVTNHGNLLFSRASDLTIATAIAGSGSISNVGSAGTVTLSGNVSGTTVTMSGSGALALTASNSYAGLTRITSGTLLARHTNALGTATVGTIVEGGGTLYFDLNQPMSIADEVISLDNGTLRRGAGQVLTLGLPLALGAGGGTLSVDGGATLDLTNTAGITGTDVGLILTGGNNGNGTVSGPINLGTGALTVSGGFWNVAPNNNYTGKTFLNGGRLLIPDLTALGPNPGVATPDFVTFNGGLLAVTNSQTFSGGTRGLTSSGGGTLFVQDAAATLTVSGDLNGSGNFTKWGPGTLILSGVNSFAGSFYVDSTGFGNDGITRIASPNALANVPVPRAGIMKSLYVKPLINTLDGNLSVTLYRNGIATALTLTILPGSTTVASNVLDSIAVSAGDLLMLGTTVSAASIGNWRISGSVSFE